MDISLLVVGQEVRMNSGPYCCRGRVTKVTPEIVEVWISPGVLGPKMSGMTVKFDKDGKECTWDKKEYPKSWMGTYECGPWELTDV